MDTGPPSFHGGSSPVTHALETVGIGDLEHIFLTHFDQDHRGGIESILARHKVKGGIWFREEHLFAKNAVRVLLAAERAGVPIRFITDQNSPTGFKCWLTPFTEGNNSSPLCLAAPSSQTSILFTGDMGSAAENWYLTHIHPFPKARILKVAHHGSSTSSNFAFLSKTGAETALISVGARNRYGHPSADTLSRLDRMGIKIQRTDRDGSVSFYDWKSYLWPFTEDIALPPLATLPPEPRLAIDAAGASTSLLKPGSPATARRR